MDVRDIPYLDDPARLIGRGSYQITEDETLAVARAARIAILPWYRSWPWAIAFFGFWHAMALYGIYLLLAPRAEGEPPNFFGLPVAITSGYMLWKLLYGLDRQARAAFRKSPMAGDDYGLAFTPDRFIVHTRLADASLEWPFLRRVVELRDGFALVQTPKSAIWLPDHALAAPFDHRAAAELFRSKVPKYRVVNRSARRGPPPGAVPDPA